MEKKYQDAYEEVLNAGKGAPDNFGSVYIINLLFFISKGALPIYDRFAHKALRALLEDVKPSDVFLNDAPSKREVKKVMIMYNEYLRLMEAVFGKNALRANVEKCESNKDMFISRELDQALWVYGHDDKKFEVV